MGDTLAFRSDEGRGYRRNASGSWKQAKIRRSPNEARVWFLFEFSIKVVGFYCSTILNSFMSLITEASLPLGFTPIFRIYTQGNFQPSQFNGSQLNDDLEQ